MNGTNRLVQQIHKRCGGQVVVMHEKKSRKVQFACNRCAYIWKLSALLPLEPSEDWRDANTRDPGIQDVYLP